MPLSLGNATTFFYKDKFYYTFISKSTKKKHEKMIFTCMFFLRNV